jgi:hypothetical protein
MIDVNVNLFRDGHFGVCPPMSPPRWSLFCG